MNKTELISAVSKAAGLKKADAAKAVDAVFDTISSSLASGEDVRVVGFGIFDVKERAERTGINPHTKEKLTIPAIPASKAPIFKASKTLKDMV